MTDKAVISGEYVTFKHVKTRKVVVLEVEVPEEYFQDVIAKLGMPIGGESKPVAVCLLNCDNKNSNATTKVAIEKTEGDKLRERACILCGEASFQDYIFYDCGMKGVGGREVEFAKDYIYNVCEISSRKELVTDKVARGKFIILDRKYKEWLKPPIEEQYADNISKY